MPSPSRRGPLVPIRRRTGTFHRESTRLRSNVADQVQRDLLPAGRMLQVFLVLCELLAEIAVLAWSRGKPCDRPLRFWVAVLIVLQTGTVLLNCLSILCGRDSFTQHRNGLSASDLDMYTDNPAAPPPSPPPPTSSPMITDHSRSTHSVQNNNNTFLPSAMASTSTTTTSTTPSSSTNDPVVVEISSSPKSYPSHQSSIAVGASNDDTRPLLASSVDEQISNTAIASSAINPSHTTPISSTNRNSSMIALSTSSSSSSNSLQFQPQNQSQPTQSSSSSSSSHSRMRSSSPTPNPSSLISTNFVDRYVRIVNLWYLIWFILGSVWVSDAGTCSTTAPHLYRLIVALTIIYYALLFLPLACFCLIVCCLPLFILVYRIMLPYAERERRRARAADPAQVRGLDSIVYSPDTFASQTGSTCLEDASCVICLCDYEEDEVVRVLPCKHHFHKDCVDVWLRLDKACCLCKQDIDSQSNQLSSAV